jgi:hypothetical protein
MPDPVSPPATSPPVPAPTHKPGHIEFRYDAGYAEMMDRTITRCNEMIATTDRPRIATYLQLVELAIDMVASAYGIDIVPRVARSVGRPRKERK